MYVHILYPGPNRPFYPRHYFAARRKAHVKRTPKTLPETAAYKVLHLGHNVCSTRVCNCTPPPSPIHLITLPFNTNRRKTYGFFPTAVHNSQLEHVAWAVCIRDSRGSNVEPANGWSRNYPLSWKRKVHKCRGSKSPAIAPYHDPAEFNSQPSTPFI